VQRVNFLIPAKKRVQKIPVNAGLSCPNRDGTISTGGCHFCNNDSFSPYYCSDEKSISLQLDEGIDFFVRKYRCHSYLAYFQASSNTNASIATLKSLYSEALAHPQISGLVIATRPDCLSEEILELLKQINSQKPVRIEIGIESCNDEILNKINRGHDFATTKHAIKRLCRANLEVCGHIILGLPGESLESQISGAKKIGKTGLQRLKIHHLQLIKDTFYAQEWFLHPHHFELLNFESYIKLLADFLILLSGQGLMKAGPDKNLSSI
jgi:radical SAM protein (TIGR01212 family)